MDVNDVHVEVMSTSTALEEADLTYASVSG